MPRFRLDEEAIGKAPAEDREQLREALAVQERVAKTNPLWSYDPHPKQRLFHRAGPHLAGDLFTKAFVGGNRSGKSWGGTVDDLIEYLDRAALPPWLAVYKRREPPVYGRVTTPDLGRGAEIAVELFRKWTPSHQLLAGRWDKAYDKRRRRLWFQNGSWCDFLSVEQELSAHAGDSLHMVRFDEEPPGRKGEQVYSESLTRLMDDGGTAKFTMTPLLGLSWTYDELTKDGDPRDDDEVLTIPVDMDDNPHTSKRAKRRLLKRIKTKEEREARKSGRWVHMQGLVYDEFREEVHVIPETPPPVNAKIVVGIDPGLRYMAGIVWCWLDAGDRLVAFAELPAENMTVAQVAYGIHQLNEFYGVKPYRYVIDPAAQNRAHQTGRSDQMEYADHGIYTVLGQNAVRPGINRTKERLQSNPPRLLITANCLTLIHQIKRYRWRTEPRGESGEREEVVKRDDHELDSLRYIVMDRPQAPDAVSAEEEAMQKAVEELGPQARKRHERFRGDMERRQRQHTASDLGLVN